MGLPQNEIAVAARATTIAAMPKSSSKQPKLVADLDAKLAPLGHFRARPMFGGYGLYLDGTIFGLIAWDKVWLRVDDRSRPAFENAGMEPFTYSRSSKAVTLTYFRCPDPVLADAGKLRKWAKEARRASLERQKPTRRRASRPRISDLG
jgi:DNA transformation protein